MSANVMRLFQVKPLLSVDNNEARLRVLSLYKAWCRQLPFMVSEFDIPVNEVQAKAKLREKFTANAHIKDARVIDMMVIKGQQDLQEVAEKWASSMHIMSKHFKESVKERPKDFMSKFLTGSD
eukprot:06170.XXX_173931_174369_1 [CDS] Oithona nana genome sequencing.